VVGRTPDGAQPGKLFVDDRPRLVDERRDVSQGTRRLDLREPVLCLQADAVRLDGPLLQRRAALRLVAAAAARRRRRDRGDQANSASTS
jgi:hypothetical protein